MKFTLFVIVVAAVLFVGYFGINTAVAKITYEPVTMEMPVVKINNIFPTGMLYLADGQRESYAIKNYAYLKNSDDAEYLQSLQKSLIIVDPNNFTQQELQQIKANKKYVIAELNINEKNTNEKIKDYLNSGYNGFYLSGVNNESDIAVIQNLSNKIKAINGNALVVGEAKFLSNTNYINYIDGILAENVFYKDNLKAVNTQLLDELNSTLNKGKFVLSVDYSKGLNNRCNFVNNSRANKFIAFVASKDLDEIPSFTCDEIKFSQ